jgi:hypothetical protein
MTLLRLFWNNAKTLCYDTVCLSIGHQWSSWSDTHNGTYARLCERCAWRETKTYLQFLLEQQSHNDPSP